MHLTSMTILLVMDFRDTYSLFYICGASYGCASGPQCPSKIYKKALISTTLNIAGRFKAEILLHHFKQLFQLVVTHARHKDEMTLAPVPRPRVCSSFIGLHCLVCIVSD